VVKVLDELAADDAIFTADVGTPAILHEHLPNDNAELSAVWYVQGEQSAVVLYKIDQCHNRLEVYFSSCDVYG